MPLKITVQSAIVDLRLRHLKTMQIAQYRKQTNAYQLKRLEKVKFSPLNPWDTLGDKALLLLNRGVLQHLPFEQF